MVDQQSPSRRFFVRRRGFVKLSCLQPTLIPEDQAKGHCITFDDSVTLFELSRGVSLDLRSISDDFLVAVTCFGAFGPNLWRHGEGWPFHLSDPE